jgi:coenzyme F420-dependent glucose-6-phosphate dehydrogenase
MTTWGYTLSSEEFAPLDLVHNAHLAEDAGFEFLTVSDHYHPWVQEQGHSPFVWSTLGGVAARTSRVLVGTGVTCPILRIHPAIVAQAAATAASMLPGRFFLGVGTGEALNEHVTGLRWPPVDVRREMLEEAVTVMRKLWSGSTVDHRGEYYTVENARLFTAPPEGIPVVMAAAGEQAADLAGRVADGVWSTSPDPSVVEAYRGAGGKGTAIGQVTLCWAPDRETAVDTALRVWPNAAIPGQLSQDLPTWTHFEQAAKLVTKDAIAEQVPCGPDPGPVLELLDRYVEAGFDRIHVHQIGPDQQGFVRFWLEEVAPELQRFGTDAKPLTPAPTVDVRGGGS